jgi:hypothetical protein
MVDRRRGIGESREVEDDVEPFPGKGDLEQLAEEIHGAVTVRRGQPPAGVPERRRKVTADKAVRVRNYALALESDLQMITHACGLTHPSQMNRTYLAMNVSPGVRKSLAEIYPYPRRERSRSRWSPAIEDRIPSIASAATGSRPTQDLCLFAG